MPELGRAALILCLGLSLYATIAGSLAAHARRRRLPTRADHEDFRRMRDSGDHRDRRAVGRQIEVRPCW